MMFDPEYEVRGANQRMTIDQRNAAEFRLAREGREPNFVVRIYDGAILKAASGALRRQEARGESWGKSRVPNP